MFFFIIPSGESYCNDRSKEFSKSRNTLKSIQSILRRKIAYDIMLAGKEIISPCGQKSKSPRSCSFQGFLLISFFITVDKESSGQSSAVCSIDDNC